MRINDKRALAFGVFLLVLALANSIEYWGLHLTPLRLVILGAYWIAALIHLWFAFSRNHQAASSNTKPGNS
jgi:hypothetical protein